MAVRSLPVDVEMVGYLGTDLTRDFRWLPDGRTPQDFTDWHGLMLVGPKGGRAVAEMHCFATRAEYEQFFDPTPGAYAYRGLWLLDDGVIRVTCGRYSLKRLSATKNLFYTLDLTDPDGAVLRLLRGRFQIVREVDRG